MPSVLEEPELQLPPSSVAPDTFVVHEIQHALGVPLSVYINSAVIRAAEPVLVDTGSARNRTRWLEDTFGIVDPEEVAWIFISHEDPDHVGNLAEVMTLCPNATLVCNWALVERYTNAFDFPLARCRWLEDGDRLNVGDRELVIARPPVYDSPTTRGLFDPTTGVYWAADAFATPVPGGRGASEVAADSGDLDTAMWEHGLCMFAWNALAPWLGVVDEVRFGAEVDRLAGLGPKTIISGHSPAITGTGVDKVLALTRQLPGERRPPAPDQGALELWLAATEHGASAGPAVITPTA